MRILYEYVAIRSNTISIFQDIDLSNYIQEDIIQIQKLEIISVGYKCPNKKLNEKSYWNEMVLFFRDSYRVLKHNKKFILVIGNYKNMKKNFINLALKTGFYIERILKREIVNIKKKKNIEYVLFLKK